MSEQLWTVLRRNKRFKEFFDSYNDSIANALVELEESPYPILGRDAEIEQLYAILERPRTPVAMLIGHAGVGKSATVEEFARQLNNNSAKTVNKSKYLLISLQVGKLKALGTSKLQSALASILSKLKEVEELAQDVEDNPNIKVVLFIDEVHMLVTIFGPGTKIGGDLLKAELARTPIRVIAATTRREYDSTIAVDPPLAQRFKSIEMNELPKSVVKTICRSWWEKIAKSKYEYPSDDIISRVLDANAMYRAEEAEPRKTLDILEDFVSYCYRENKPITNHVVDEIFKRRFSISLSTNIDPKAIFNEITSRIIGQPYAIETLRKLTQSLVFRLDPTSNKPLATALFTGPTSTGKTETAKAIADSLYPGTHALFNLNMPDFKTEESDELMRRRVGERVRHQPNSVVLFDEFEKAHQSVKDSFLAMLDEGIVTFTTYNREGLEESHSVSLRNTVIIATTNAGSNIFQDDGKYSQELKYSQSGNEHTRKIAMDAEIESLMKRLRNNLQTNGFKPELLARFNRIVPYRNLPEKTLLDISERELDMLAKKFKDLRGITITYNEPRDWKQQDTRYPYVARDVALYITFTRMNSNDAKNSGARRIKNEVNSLVYDAIVDSIIDNPLKTHFRVSISKDASIYDKDAALTVGGVEVRAY